MIYKVSYTGVAYVEADNAYDAELECLRQMRVDPFAAGVSVTASPVGKGEPIHFEWRGIVPFKGAVPLGDTNE